MKIQEKVERCFIADDGAMFSTESECQLYEMVTAKNYILNSCKYIVGHTGYGGVALMKRFKRKEYKNGKIAYYEIGRTYNVKYAYKFDSFEEAYKVGGNNILTLEECKKATEIHLAKEATKKKKEQRYVCEFDLEPTVTGEYITNLGMGKCVIEDGEDAYWDFEDGEKPEFWMKKVNLTAR